MYAIIKVCDKTCAHKVNTRLLHWCKEWLKFHNKIFKSNIPENARFKQHKNVLLL